jgi:serine/threonine protein kinase
VQAIKGTLFFQSPDLLLDHIHADKSIDMWSYGCILASLMLKGQPLFFKTFKGINKRAQLLGIEKVLPSSLTHPPPFFIIIIIINLHYHYDHHPYHPFIL